MKTVKKEHSNFKFWTIFLLFTLLCFITSPKDFKCSYGDVNVHNFLWFTICEHNHTGDIEAFGFLGFEIPIDKNCIQ